MPPRPTRIAAAQAAYYLATGAAPLVSIGAFERITGPKTDDWLVKTVGMSASERCSRAMPPADGPTP